MPTLWWTNRISVDVSIKGDQDQCTFFDQLKAILQAKMKSWQKKIVMLSSRRTLTLSMDCGLLNNEHFVPVIDVVLARSSQTEDEDDHFNEELRELERGIFGIAHVQIVSVLNVRYQPRIYCKLWSIEEVPQQ